jgi:EmrB/QacA subfamily drug resistance transporter
MESGNVKNIVLLIAVLAGFLTPFMGASVNVALPTIGREFGMDPVQLSWVATAYLLASAVFLVPFGKLADMVGRKKIFTVGIAVFSASSLLSVVSTSGIMLIVSRALQGAGSALIFGTSMAMMTSVFPPGERGKALGINVAAVYLGLTCGPVLGGLMTQHFGWRSLFVISAALGSVVLLIVLKKLKTEWADGRGEPFDLVGAILYGVMLTGLIYGLSKLPSLLGTSLLGGSLVGLFVFAWWENRTRNPVLDFSLFRDNRVFAFSNLAAFINYSATFAVVFLLSLYLQEIRGLDPQAAGLVLMAQPIVMTICSPFAGRLSDRLESRMIASLGMGVTTLALMLFALINSATGLTYIVVALLVFGFGLALFSSPNTNAIMSSVEKQYYGVASAAVGTMRLTGQMFSMGIAMMIFALYVGRVKITPEQHPVFLASIKMAFLVFGVLCAFGVFASLARGKSRG